MYYKEIVFIFSMLQMCQSAIERDLLLTPKENLQKLGRAIYYNPPGYEINGTVAWEQTLKHATFLTLFPEAVRNTNLSNLQEYKEFMRAPYMRIHEDYPKFGDIITMARGWLEKSDIYRFKEGECETGCDETALALWRVQKIRHRDKLRGFRYEMKFSITPLESQTHAHSKHPLNKQFFKSFIVKDDEYPKSFNTLTRRSDNVENFSNEREARIINHISREDVTDMPRLNIGEYFKQVPKASSKVGYLPNLRNDLPTTYRPNYRVKFAQPEVYEEPEEHKTVVTHHFHHHYFMKDAAEASQNEAKQIFHGNPDAIRIIEPPSNVQIVSPRYVLTTTTEAPPPPPPPPAVYLMHQIPLYIQSFPEEMRTTSRPFRQSEQHFEEIRYSDPDPLYENADNSPSNSAESASVESNLQVERPSYTSLNLVNTQYTDHQNIHAPYIINKKKEKAAARFPYLDNRKHNLVHAPYVVEDNKENDPTQLPFVDEWKTDATDHRPSDDDKKESTTTMYSDESEESTTTTTSTKHATLAFSTRRTLLPKNKFFVTPPPSTSENPIKYPTKQSGQNIRTYARSTTEQPILKWKPKRKQKQTPDSAAIQSSKEERVITVTPSKAEFEILTQKSVSRSFSVKVGNHSQEIPLVLETATTTISSEDYDESSTDQNDTNP